MVAHAQGTPLCAVGEVGLQVVVLWFWIYPYYDVCQLLRPQLVYNEHMEWRLQYLGRLPTI